MLKDLSLSEKIYRCDLCGTWKKVISFASNFWETNEEDEPQGESRYQYLDLCRECINIIYLISCHNVPIENIKVKITKKNTKFSLGP
jgi:hypothetical protein